MAKKKYVVRTTTAQRSSLATIKVLLAEKGYHIFPVAKQFRRHHLDFVAVLNSNPAMTLVVRPARRGIIEFRPFAFHHHYYGIRKMLIKYKDSFGKMHWTKQLPTRDGYNGWKAFLSKKHHADYILLAR